MYEAYGADTLRVYEMSMGPLDLSRPWETRAVVGAQRFLQRLWRNVVDETTGELVVSDDAPSAETLRVLSARGAITIVLVEQNLDFVTGLAGRVYAISNGILDRQIPRGQLTDPRAVSEFMGFAT